MCRVLWVRSNLVANTGCVAPLVMRSIGHSSLTSGVLLVMQVFEFELKFTGNSVHPEVTLMNSTIQTVVGALLYNLDGEIGDPFSFPFNFATTDILSAVTSPTTTTSGIEVSSALVQICCSAMRPPV